MDHDRLLVSLRWVNRFLAVGLVGSTGFLIHQVILWRNGPTLPIIDVASSEPSSIAPTVADTTVDSLLSPAPPFSQYESLFQRQGLFAAPQPFPAERDARPSPDGSGAKRPSPNRSSLRLVGIVQGEVPQAIIAGSGGRLLTVSPNERIEEFRVIAIEQSRVRLDDDGEPFDLTL